VDKIEKRDLHAGKQTKLMNDLQAQYHQLEEQYRGLQQQVRHLAHMRAV
jgi:hypothetical protein